MSSTIMKSDPPMPPRLEPPPPPPPPPEPLEGLSRLLAVEPRLEPLAAPAEEEPRCPDALALVEEPDISLKRLVLPRVAPILEVVPDPAGVPDPPPDPVKDELPPDEEGFELLELEEELLLEGAGELPPPPPPL